MAELTYEAVKNMTASEFKKEFKAQKALFKKATYLVAVVDYKLSDKKQTILLPYRKKSEAKADFKLLKKDKNAKMSNTVAGELKAGQSPEQVIFEIQKGGGTPESVGGELMGYFEGLAMKLQVKQGKIEEEEADEAETTEKPATKISDAVKEANPADKTNESKPAKPLPKEDKNPQQKAIMEELITSCKLVYADIAKLKAEKDKAKKEKIMVVMFKKLDAWLKNYEAHRNDFPTHAKLEEAYAGLTEVWEAITDKKRAPMPDLAPEAEDATKEEKKPAPKFTESNLPERVEKALKEALEALNEAINKERAQHGGTETALFTAGSMQKYKEAYLAAKGKRPLKAMLAKRAAFLAYSTDGAPQQERISKLAGLDAILAKYGLE